MKISQKTLTEISRIFDKQNIPWILTRITKKAIPDDFDILIKPDDFKKAKVALRENGYQLLSHDHALGGRKPGAQINAVKNDRIKIDLHQNFTWRKKQYIDLDFLWKNAKNHKLPENIDAFLIAVNIIFEKTYLNIDELELIKNNIVNEEFELQAKKHHWKKTYNLFVRWVTQQKNASKEPVFMPFWLVMFSYLQKFNLISFLYYLFFRVRYTIKNMLPYE